MEESPAEVRLQEKINRLKDLYDLQDDELRVLKLTSKEAIAELLKAEKSLNERGIAIDYASFEFEESELGLSEFELNEFETLKKLQGQRKNEEQPLAEKQPSIGTTKTLFELLED